MFRIGFPNGLAGKQSACNARGTGKVSSIPGLGRSPWKRKWQPTLVFLPGKSHGQSTLAGYSPRSQTQLTIKRIQHWRQKCLGNFSSCLGPGVWSYLHFSLLYHTIPVYVVPPLTRNLKLPASHVGLLNTVDLHLIRHFLHLKKGECTSSFCFHVFICCPCHCPQYIRLHFYLPSSSVCNLSTIFSQVSSLNTFSSKLSSSSRQ